MKEGKAKEEMPVGRMAVSHVPKRTKWLPSLWDEHVRGSRGWSLRSTPGYRL